MTSTHVGFLDKATPPHLVTLVLMASMPAMAMNLFLPALPAMAEHFDTNYGVMQLAVGIFLAVNAVLQLFIGPLADRYGRRPLVLGGFTIFLFATIGAIFAPSVQAFLILRAVQAGVVTGMVLSRAIVRDIVPDEQAASKIAYVTMGMSVVPMIAPFVGGKLTAAFGWQSNFWLLAIFGAGVTTLVFFDQGETRPKDGITSTRDMIRAFPDLLSSQRFLGYAFSTAAASGAFFAYLGGAPYVGSQIFGLSADKLGLYMSTPALGYFAGNFIAGRYSTWVGPNRMILIGALILIAATGTNAALWAMGLHDPEIFFGLMILLGFANGMQLPNAMAGTLSVRPNLSGTAAGLGGTMMIGGGAALSALAGTLLNHAAGALSLLLIMLGSSIASLFAILWVLHRTRVVSRT